MTEHTAENDRPRYAEVHIPLSGSNVRTVVLVTCRDCGAFVFDRAAHDDHHPRGGTEDTAENDAPECERCEGTGDRYGRAYPLDGHGTPCVTCKGSGRVIPPEVPASAEPTP